MEEIPGHFHHRRSYSSNSCLQGGEDFGIASQQLEYDGPRRKSQVSYTAYYHDSLVCGSNWFSNYLPWVLQRLCNTEKCSTTAQGPMSTETVLSHHCCFNTWNCARDVQHRYKMIFSWGSTLKVTSGSEGHTYFSFCCCMLFFRTFLKKNIWEQQLQTQKIGAC